MRFFEQIESKAKLKKKSEINDKSTEHQSKLTDNFTASETVSKLIQNSQDIKIDRFDISARGKDLLINAHLSITHGRRYGLVSLKMFAYFNSVIF